MLKVKLQDGATIPKRATEGSACYDLYSNEEGTIPAHSRRMFDTGVYVEFPNQFMLQILSRSGLSLKHGLQVGAGIVDSDYRGSIKVLLYNHSDSAYHIEKHDKIAQMALIHIETPDIEVVNEINDTDRGENGFGSTG
ncbi:hypothetical protein GUITHDRAFT_82757 [Guillardia theta CCMP2712]|uniref:Deoxyuridine 5'-triphosphate nucleotidohydrolase n=1 Tax=Guillardia theta (strain CCMP2712) TaxID=905079 RepID=L1I6G8_GUITC|nr:hypothetical protein GUITHDRAFT_82757 [Guillardia theta CCMP2712]EKX31848.1 hypothetical protein GUITHDRAFT_82757 [Guillardia theta CCMP2712]|eukprot:XP_005818828.1 hypothetical protein GUITHDRAFT_82757 [Guillardia theta CCMP2712]